MEQKSTRSKTLKTKQTTSLFKSRGNRGGNKNTKQRTSERREEKRSNKPNLEMPDLSDSDETTAVERRENRRSPVFVVFVLLLGCCIFKGRCRY